MSGLQELWRSAAAPSRTFAIENLYFPMTEAVLPADRAVVGVPGESTVILIAHLSRKGGPASGA
jgi:hypothetical protein